MSNISSSTPPTVKRHGHGYTRRVKRLIALLSSGAGNLSRAEVARQTHYWLDASFETEGRRQRSPSERLNDQRVNATPKDSVKV